MQTRRAGRFSVSPGRSNTVPPSFARFKNTSAPRERLFPHTEPFYEAFVRSLRSHPMHASKTRLFSTNSTFLRSLHFSLVRSLRHTSKPLSAKPTNSSPQLHFLFLATPSQQTGQGLARDGGRKKRELSFHHHRINNKTASYASRHTCNVHFTIQPS